MGVQTIIVTDISKDGTLQGPNMEMLQELKQAVRMHIIDSGGVRDLTHIAALKKLDIYGAITGKAVVCGKLDLPAAIALCEEG